MMHTRTMEEREWMSRAGKALRESEQQIDSMTLMRLRAARARAVAAVRSSTHEAAWRWGAPAALAAGVLAWMLVPRTVLMPEAVPEETTVNVAGTDTFEVLTDEMGPEFYENLDLYLWLEGADRNSESDSA